MGYFGCKERNKRLKRIYNNTKHSYASGVWFDDDKNRFIRYYRGKRSKYLKKLSNRKFRHMKNESLQNSQYKKVFDYWWELY